MTKQLKIGIIGDDISLLLLPEIHRYWLEKNHIEGSYEVIDIKPDELENFIKNLSANGFKGVDIAKPYKVEVMKYVERIEGTSIGHVNMVFINKTGILGAVNTESYGLQFNIEALNMIAGEDRHLPGINQAVILGAGEAAETVITALALLRIKHLIVLNRHAEKAERIVKKYNHMFKECESDKSYDGLNFGHPYVGTKIESFPWEERHSLIRNADLLANATSLGMEGQPELQMNLDALPAHAYVMDMVYKPYETALLRSAKARGNKTIDGLGIVLHQAQMSFTLWSGIHPEITSELRAYAESYTGAGLS